MTILLQNTTMSQNRLIDPNIKKDDVLDRAIRPTSLADYIGQPKVREQMEVFIGAAKKRREALDHTLIFGPPGLGKTTLANIIAREMGGNLRSTSGPVLERAGDLATIHKSNMHVPASGCLQLVAYLNGQSLGNRITHIGRICPNHGSLAYDCCYLAHNLCSQCWRIKGAQRKNRQAEHQLAPK